MNDLWQLLLKGDPVVFIIMATLVAILRVYMRALKQPEVAPDGLVTDWDIRGQVAGIDWNAARTFGYLPMSQHVVIAESELAKGLAGSAIFREGIAMPPAAVDLMRSSSLASGSAESLRVLDDNVAVPAEDLRRVMHECAYCGTWNVGLTRMSCEKCGAPLIPSAAKPVEWPAPTTPGWTVR